MAFERSWYYRYTPLMFIWMVRKMGLCKALTVGVIAAFGMTDPAFSQGFDPFERRPAANSILERQRQNEEEVEQFEILIPYEEEMRRLIEDISDWSKRLRPDFKVIAMNGLELIRHLEDTNFNTRDNAMTAGAYVKAIDGVLIEGLFYGNEEFGKETHPDDHEYYTTYIDDLKQLGVPIMTLDYVNHRATMQKIYQQASELADLVFVSDAPHFALNNLPEYPARPDRENHRPVFTLQEAHNYAIVLNSQAFGSKDNYVAALANTNYDLLIIDAFHAGRISLTFEDMHRLRYKRLGTRRLLFAYMSIGAAETYRYYWQRDWNGNRYAANFIAEPIDRPRSGSEHHVRYWESAWQDILYGHDRAYLTGLIQLGFDGVVLGNIDNYQRWRDF